MTPPAAAAANAAVVKLDISGGPSKHEDPLSVAPLFVPLPSTFWTWTACASVVCGASASRALSCPLLPGR